MLLMEIMIIAINAGGMFPKHSSDIKLDILGSVE